MIIHICNYHTRIKLAFSNKVKEEAMRRAFFRCVICQNPFVEIHHIIPQEEGGPDTIDNAAAVCSRCHDLYGGNPYKRKQIRLMRDHWYEKVEKMTSVNIENFEPIEPDERNVNAMCDKKTAIYHVVFAEESFSAAAKTIVELVSRSQKVMPNYNRSLYLDIEGHRNPAGGFEADMIELMRDFLLNVMMKYLTVICTPLYQVKNNKLQENDIPEELKIYVEE